MDDEQDYPEEKSKSQVKREYHALQDLALELTQLKPSQLQKLELPEPVLRGIAEFQNISAHGARKRQLKFLGKLLREADLEDATQQLGMIEEQRRNDNASLHRLEQWRERLLDDENSLNELIEQYPQVDRQHLRQLLRGAQQERINNKPPKNFRKLFQYLKEVITD